MSNRKIAIYLLMLAGTMITLFSCKKYTAGSGTPGAPPYVPNVYVLGSENGSTLLWKNGQSTTLPAGTLPTALSIADSSDVYTVENTGDPYQTTTSSSALILKNAMGTKLTDSNYDAIADAVFISGVDVYVAGTKYNFFDPVTKYTTNDAVYPEMGNHAVIWKNGNVMTLPSYHTLGVDTGYGATLYNDYISSLFVTGNDVYVAGGSLYNPAHAEYWKNGVVNVLPNGSSPSSGTIGQTTGIFASGSDVYITGFEFSSGSALSTAGYWKNSVFYSLGADTIQSSVASSVFISGSDVYMAGYGNINGYSVALLWKNGVLLSELKSPTQASSVASSVFVYGKDIYVTGYSWNIYHNNIATLWKNGVASNLSDGTFDAVADAVVVQ